MSAVDAPRRILALRAGGALQRLCSDERLAALARGGSEAALDALMARHRPRLLTFCTGMLGSAHEAEEAVRAVAIDAYRSMLADEGPILVRAWLYRIARTQSLCRIDARSDARDPVAPRPSDGGSSTAAPEDPCHDPGPLMADIGRLDARLRAAILLRELVDLTYLEIAAAMQMTVPSTKSLLVQARVALAEMGARREAQERLPG